MGAIQNSINQTLGAAAAAAIVGKKDYDAKQAEIKSAAKEQEEGLLAKEHFHEAQADLTRLAGETEEAEKKLQEKQAISDALANKKPGGKGNTKAAINERYKASLTETEAAARALKELQQHSEAKKAMLARAEIIMKRTGIIGGNE